MARGKQKDLSKMKKGDTFKRYGYPCTILGFSVVGGINHVYVINQMGHKFWLTAKTHRRVI